MSGPGYEQVVYDLRRHSHVCRCGADLRTLDSGAPAVCVYRDEVSGEITCSDACAIEVVTERRALADAVARRSA